MEEQKLLLFAGLLEDDFVRALARHDDNAATRVLCQQLCKGGLGWRPVENYVLWLLLKEPSLLALRAAAGEYLAASLMAQAAVEIAVLQGWLQACHKPDWLQSADDPDWLPDSLTSWVTDQADHVAENLAGFYQRFGFGELALHRVWRWDGRLTPVHDFDAITLSDLIGYQSQKEEVMQNTRLFVRTGRGNNLLLYGARGTGKSSLIKAVANELAAEGLCLVELPLDRIADLPHLQAVLSRQPRHYIIYIDDLSFEKADQDYKLTKAVLEGSVAALGGNVLIYATSNRRHLIVENWQDREGARHENGEVRAADSMSEKLSLADRFGQTVLFTTPNQEEYLRIVAALAEADGVTLPQAELRERALQWALWQNGCSGRTARQFVNSLTAGGVK